MDENREDSHSLHMQVIIDISMIDEIIGICDDRGGLAASYRLSLYILVR